MRICAFVRVRHVRVWGRARVYTTRWASGAVEWMGRNGGKRGWHFSGSEGGISAGARAGPEAPKTVFSENYFF